jgi:DNA-binding response OmpR family regulator
MPFKARRIGAEMSAPLALLVDPDAETRSLYRAALEHDAWYVEEAIDGREALARTIAERPELLITETHLPGMSGFDLCVQVRADADVFATRIIVVTATRTPGAIVHAHEAGADRVLIKPCPPDRLLISIAEVRAESRAIVQRAQQSVGELYDDIMKTRERIEDSRLIIRQMRERLDRRITTLPPVPPPTLLCPTCDEPMRYERSYIGGASVSEQWDVFVCGSCARAFQFRHRTRKITPFTR